MKNSILIYEDTPQYDLWLKIILGLALAYTFIWSLLLLNDNLDAALIMFGTTLFDALLFKAILPKRFQLYTDRLVIVLGGPFSLKIPFDNIIEIKAARTRKNSIFWGIKFATSTRHVVEIVQNKGMNIIISPRNDDMFIEQFNQVIKDLKRN